MFAHGGDLGENLEILNLRRVEETIYIYEMTLRIKTTGYVFHWFSVRWQITVYSIVSSASTCWGSTRTTTTTATTTATTAAATTSTNTTNKCCF